MKKKIKYSVCIVIILAMILDIGTAQYMINFSLKPDVTASRNIETSWNNLKNNNADIAPWVDSIRTNHILKDTFIVSPDGCKLHAFYKNAVYPTGNTAILIHGYTSNAIFMMNIGHIYSEYLRYNILLPDNRFHGESEGSHIQMGWKDRKDILQWMKVAQTMYGDSLAMVVHGISMGGATTMMLSGDNLPGYVKCFVDDCGYTSVWDEFKKEMKVQFNIPPFPILYTASALNKIEHGWGFKEASSLKQVTKCKLPMLFIHGAEDDYVPTDMVYPLYKAKPEPKELWIVQGAAHAEAYITDRQAYRKRVYDFVSKYMK